MLFLLTLWPSKLLESQIFFSHERPSNPTPLFADEETEAQKWAMCPKQQGPGKARRTQLKPSALSVLSTMLISPAAPTPILDPDSSSPLPWESSFPPSIRTGCVILGYSKKYIFGSYLQFLAQSSENLSCHFLSDRGERSMYCHNIWPWSPVSN